MEAWVGGAERVAHTHDGGDTWKPLHLDAEGFGSPALQRMVAGGPNANSYGQIDVHGLYFWSSVAGYAWCVVQERGEGEVFGYAVLVTDDGVATGPQGRPALR